MASSYQNNICDRDGCSCVLTESDMLFYLSPAHLLHLVLLWLGSCFPMWFYHFSVVLCFCSPPPPHPPFHLSLYFSASSTCANSASHWKAAITVERGIARLCYAVQILCQQSTIMLAHIDIISSLLDLPISSECLRKFIMITQQYITISIFNCHTIIEEEAICVCGFCCFFQSICTAVFGLIILDHTIFATYSDWS